MKHLSKAAFAAVAAIAISPIAAQAQEQQAQCGPREAVVEMLNTQFGEAQQFEMINQDGRSVIEIYANEETGAWTTIQSDTNGQSCFVAGGGYFVDADDHELPNFEIPLSTMPAPGSPCGPRANMKGSLEHRYGEERQAAMLAPDLQSVFEVFANETEGSWTVLSTDTQGLSCMVMAGKGFNDLPGTLPPRGIKI